MLNDPLFILGAIASLVVLGILLVGVGGFARGGEFNRKHANRLMRWRLGAQFVAVILIVAFAWFKAQTG
ncbi:twin transmembrane helix small protein [Rhodobacteraceae bacterium 2376]|uniref:Twin transmembrane helix small protein n=1 Tax=Rhabdonatronobacter sediminivivens TaxID=2743469 RepID=A0A7Z0HXL8_9RHOB|nr:twin transmembrane helix small protein [Rhabdonatronobacter sediminivivens]NYS24181.1 twin transmembrane helix small protein [Rhabdonatronobacter sediminivivens]